MKLHVSTEEKQREVPGTGGIFRASDKEPIWIVSLQLEITEEERVIATKCRIWDEEFFSTRADPRDYDNSSPAAAMVSSIGFSATLKSLVGGSGNAFRTPIEAKRFEKLFVETGIPKLKALFDIASQPDAKPRVYEF